MAERVMLGLGEFRFEIATLAYQKFSLNQSWRWQEQARLNRDPALQFAGRNVGEIELDQTLASRDMINKKMREVIEEASIGGLGAHVLTFASDNGLVDAGLKIRTMRLPDRFIDQDKPEKQYDEAGLNAPHVVETVLKALRVNSAGIEEVRA